MNLKIIYNMSKNKLSLLFKLLNNDANSEVFPLLVSFLTFYELIQA